MRGFDFLDVIFTVLMMRLSSIKAAVVAPVLAVLVGSSCWGQTITGHAKITDGDTLNLGPVIIRIHGIDAPEAGQPCNIRDGGTWECGTAASNALADLVLDHEITCEALDRDGYGRIVSRCFADDEDIGAALITAGLAWSFRKYSGDYAALEDVARGEGVGIWEADNQTPWDYRADRWNRAAAESPRPGCPIKGNIARDGERIYHTPWSPAYSRTKVSEDMGERWFCDEAEAEAEGWRAARWR